MGISSTGGVTVSSFWYDNQGVYVGRDEEEFVENNIAADVALRQDDDAWIRGSHLHVTFSTLGWPENTEALKTFHPTNGYCQ